MTTRRSFLAAIAATLVLDPERALWVPGRKMFSIPARPFLAVGDLVKFASMWGPMWPEQYIVTQEARSLVLIGDARFSVVGAAARRYWERAGFVPVDGLHTWPTFPPREVVRCR